MLFFPVAAILRNRCCRYAQNICQSLRISAFACRGRHSSGLRRGEWFQLIFAGRFRSIFPKALYRYNFYRASLRRQLWCKSRGMGQEHGKMGTLIYFDSLPKMPVCKGSAGSGFQILLKDRRAMVVVEANGCHNSPGSILGSAGRAALIVAI